MGLGGYNRTTLGVVAICFASIVFDGYDLIVYGTVVPALLKYRDWDLTAVEAGAIGSYALIGMLFGAMMVGTITDIVGRRKIMLFCISWFSLFMGLCAIAPSPELLGLFRFIAGLGLGGVVPTAIALTIEYAPPHRRSFTNALMFSGYSVGGILAALLAIPLLPAFGWRLMFAIGLAPLVLIVPLAYRFMPESVSFLVASGLGGFEQFSRRSLHLEGQAESALLPELRAGDRAFLDLLLYRSVAGVRLEHLALPDNARSRISSGICPVLPLGAKPWRHPRNTHSRCRGRPVRLQGDYRRWVSRSRGVYSAVERAATVVGDLRPRRCSRRRVRRNDYNRQRLHRQVPPCGPSGDRTRLVADFREAGCHPWPSVRGYVIASTASQLGFEWNFYAFAIPALLGTLVVLLVPRSPVAKREPSPSAARGAAPTS